jgi:positive phototaxis protein PixI
MVANFSSSPSLSLLSQINQLKQQRKQEQQFLRFVLLPDTNLMVPLRQISAVLKVGYGEIIPIPEMPVWVMGVYNWRGEIVWMIDLGQLVGFTPWYQQSVRSSHHKAILIHPSYQKKKSETSAEIIGLIVSEVEDIEWCDPNELHSPPASAVTPELAPFLRGYWVKKDGDILVTLDGDAILAAMPKK